MRKLRLSNKFAHSESNPISDVFKLQKMESKKLVQFYFEGESVKEIQNISFLFKMPMKKLKKISKAFSNLEFEEKWMVNQNKYV